MAGTLPISGSPFLQGPFVAKDIYTANDSTAVNIAGEAQFSTEPRNKFTWFVRVFRNAGSGPTSTGASKWSQGVQFTAKSVDKPKFRIETQTLNEYNKKRVIQTKIDYENVTIRFYDTIDNIISTMWWDYAGWNFGEFNYFSNNPSPWAADQTSENFNDPGSGFGRILPNATPDGASFFDRIEIYELYGNKYNTFVLINPKIVSFDFDNLDYSNTGDPQEITIQFAYEGVLWPDETTLDQGTAAELFDYRPNVVESAEQQILSGSVSANANTPSATSSVSTSQPILVGTNQSQNLNDDGPYGLDQYIGSGPVGGVSGAGNGLQNQIGSTILGIMGLFSYGGIASALGNNGPVSLNPTTDLISSGVLDGTLAQAFGDILTDLSASDSAGGIPVFRTDSVTQPVLTYPQDTQYLVPNTSNQMPVITTQYNTGANTNNTSNQSPNIIFSNGGGGNFGNNNPNIPGGGAYNVYPNLTPNVSSNSPLDPQPALANAPLIKAITPQILRNAAGYQSIVNAATSSAAYTTGPSSIPPQGTSNNSNTASAGIDAAKFDAYLGKVSGGSYTNPTSLVLASSLMLAAQAGTLGPGPQTRGVLLSPSALTALNGARSPESQIGTRFTAYGNQPWAPNSKDQTTFTPPTPNTAYNGAISYPNSTKFGYPPQYEPTYVNPNAYDYSNSIPDYENHTKYGGFSYPYRPLNGAIQYNPQFSVNSQPNYDPTYGKYQRNQPQQNVTNTGALVAAELIGGP